MDLNTQIYLEYLDFLLFSIPHNPLESGKFLILMININRSPQIPASLQSLEIQKYIADLEFYKALSPEEQANVAKPNCSESYRNADIFEAFDRDFFAKCYLTEKKAFANSYAFDIEHFKAKALSQSPELTYEWTNLYPADHDANMAKPRIDPVEGYLDPCNPGDDVETDIRYMVMFGGESHFEAVDSSNKKAINTAQLLEKIHNGHDETSRQKTANLRAEINERRNKILELILEWLGASKNKDSQKEFELRTKLKKYLSRQSSFTMLMRSMSAVRNHIPTEMLD
jgi:hypothetical protein